MLKEIRAVWKDETLMGEVMQALGQMVVDAEYVYSRAWEVCTGHALAEKTAGAVKEHDKAVNRAEREIRRMLVEHLTINPGQDVSGCLAVMIMAKDLERLGDHGSNVLAVGMRAQGGVSGFRFFEELSSIQKGIGVLFPLLGRAIVESSSDITHDVLARYTALKKENRALFEKLLESDLVGREAVITTLLARYFKRINAHIGNAASGVIFPLENIDFVSRGLKQEEKDR